MADQVWFCVVCSIAILLFVGMLTRNGFALWATFCFLAWVWATGLIVFVLQHFISKYW